MKTVLITLLLLLLTGCSQTTTYKARSNGWSKVLAAKTISLAETDCEKHHGYFQSVQIEKWGGWNNNQVWYDSIKTICNDGFIIIYPINQVEAHYSRTVVDILTNK